MKQHPATQYKRKYNDIIIKDPELSTSQPLGVIGRRTGQLFVDNKETDYDFLLKEDLPIRPPTISKDTEKYSSNSSSSESNSSNDDSSSEAEESVDEEEDLKDIKEINIEDIKKTIIQAEEDMFPLQIDQEFKKEPIKEEPDAKKKLASSIDRSFKTKEEIEKDRRESKLRFEALSSIKKFNKNDISAIDDNALLLDELNKAKKRVSMSKSEKNKANNTADSIQLDDSSFINKATSHDSSLIDINDKESKGVKEKRNKKRRNVNKTIPEEDPEKEQESQEMMIMNKNKNQNSGIFQKRKRVNSIKEEEDEDNEINNEEKIAIKEEEMKYIEQLNREIDQKKKEEQDKKEKKEKKKQEKLIKAKEDMKKKQEVIAKNKKEKEEKRQEKLSKEKEEKEKHEKLAKEKEEMKKSKEQIQITNIKQEKGKEEDKKNKKKLINNNKRREIDKEMSESDEELSLKDISLLNNQFINNKFGKRHNDKSLYDISEVNEESIQIPNKNISLTKLKSLIEDDNDNNNDYEINNTAIDNIGIISNSDLPVEKVNASNESIKDKEKDKVKVKEEKKEQIKPKRQSKANDDNKKRNIEDIERNKESKDNSDGDDNINDSDKDSDKEKKQRKKSKNKKSLPKILKDKPRKQKLQKLDDEDNQEEVYQPKKIKSKKVVTQTEYEKLTYSKMTESQPKIYDVVHSKQEQTFGKNGRYSLRMRIPRLNKLLGEKVTYIHTEYGDEIRSIYSSRKAVKDITEQYEIGKGKQRKLRKGLQKKSNIKAKDDNRNSDTDKEDEDELNDSYSEIDQDSVKLLVIKPHSQKSISRNYQTELIFRIRESSGRNSIIINDKEYRNLKKNSSVNVPPNCEYQIKNYSKTNFVVAICFIREEDSDGNNSN